MKVRVLSSLPICLHSFLYLCWRVLYSVLDEESVDSKVLVPSNKFRCKTSLLTAVRTKRDKLRIVKRPLFLPDPGVSGVRSMGPGLSNYVQELWLRLC